jgi:hypothetical protein
MVKTTTFGYSKGVKQALDQPLPAPFSTDGIERNLGTVFFCLYNPAASYKPTVFYPTNLTVKTQTGLIHSWDSRKEG